MAGSAAEERLRAMTVDRMRRLYPHGRIIHELPLEQYGVRIDLATVTTDRIVVAEIKSERDVLKRLAAQLMRAVECADEVWVVTAPKHVAAIAGLRAAWGDRPSLDEAQKEWVASQQSEDVTQALNRCVCLSPESLGSVLMPDAWSRNGAYRLHPLPDPRAMWSLMWADEQVATLRDFWGTKFTRDLARSQMCRVAVENMSMREIRRYVCAALRSREFARADPPSRFETGSDQPSLL